MIAKRLNQRERELLSLRYGLGGQRPHTQKEVADRLGISRSYVSRIWEEGDFQAEARQFPGSRCQ